jgi:hypothetical protein
MDSKVLAMQRLQDFMADAGTTSSSTRDYGTISIPAAQRDMVTKLADFDRTFSTAVKAPTITVIARNNRQT